MQTFKDNNLAAVYPRGIRFLLLVDKKENWSTKIKKSFTEVLQDFDAEENIFTLANVVERLKRNYPTNPGPFHDILAFLEWQFGEKTGEPPLPFLREMLLQGSRSYHGALTGENGRFRNLHIEDLLLSRPETESRWVPQPVSLEGDNGSSQTNETIITMLPCLWNRPVEHTVIVGEGGMGKTVSLVRLWETYLDQAAPGTNEPIPVFIALHEFNNTDTARDFIRSRIAGSYLDDERLRKGLNKLFKTRGQRSDGKTVPTVVLLLDGFNEITVEKRELLLELNRLVEEYPGVQVVMTSRYDMRGNFNWGHWNLVKLSELQEEKALEYLGDKGLAAPEQERLRKLLCNPMMLTLYAATCEVQANHRNNRYCDFKETVDAPGELLWNFMEAQVARLPERVGPKEGRVVYYRFLLKYILPGLGFEMEKAGLFVFSYAQFLDSLELLCRRFALEDFLTAIPALSKYLDLLPVGKSSNTLARHKRGGLLRDIFCNELHMLVEEGQSLRFLHQDFRDFFAAVHVLNELDISLSKKEISGVLKDQRLNYFVRRLVGEIEGEHRCKPYLVKNEGWKININKENRLNKALELCRGKFSNDEPPNSLNYSLSVWNIVMIWIEVRGELSGTNLSNLDLSRISLNNVRCSRFYEGQCLVYLAALFNGARIHEKNLLSQGHTNLIWNAVYSLDGKKILSASKDGTIKEWDVETGEWIRNIKTGSLFATGASYSLDGQRILSVFMNKTINELDAKKGHQIKILTGHRETISSAVYSPDGKKILSASYDETIKEWDAETGECENTLIGHDWAVTTAMYSSNGEKILSASWDRTIKEWNSKTGKCIKTLSGHKSYVYSAIYSPDGKKILSASDDETIIEWNVETGQCIKILTGHTDTVWGAQYSLDGKKILSVSSDQTIKEWDAITGECIKTLLGHTGCVINAIYSPDGKKILSTSKDKTIKEWDAETGECLKTLVGRIVLVNSEDNDYRQKKILYTSADQTIKEWNEVTGKCVKTFFGHTNIVTKAVYSWDYKKIFSASCDQTIKEWDVYTGQCLKTYKPKNFRIINEYIYKDLVIKSRDSLYLNYGDYLHLDYRDYEKCFNIPGLFIQGCSFKNLEKGSQWSEEGLAILRQYHAKDVSAIILR
ncbi:MAG: hypothetical protein MUF15_09645 [Acidobacteria bacterium]|nr:hypothetical protein [Acidobacteriota bacterium]